MKARGYVEALLREAVHSAVQKPEAHKPQTYEKDKNDPYANVGRNDPCPCGSGKKYKKCHGVNR